MRIVITSNYELGNETGSAKVAEELAKRLSIKNKILLICLGTKFSSYKLSKNLDILEITSININNIYVPVITPMLMYQTFRKLDQFLPEIIHAQNSILVSSLVQIWSRLNKVPFIVTFHHIPTEPIKHLLPSFSKNKLLNLVQEIYKNTSLKNTLKNSSGVIAINKAMYKSIRTVDKNIRIEVISNGIEIKELNKLKTKKLNKNNVNFIFLGSFNERKNQLFLLKVFNNLPHYYQLSLYGNRKTGGKYLIKLENYINKFNIKNIKIYDFTNDIIEAFNKSDFLVSASKKEAQSLVILQAMSAGKPIIGLENETINELVNKNNGLKIKKTTGPKVFAKEVINFVKKCNYTALSKRIRQDSKKFRIEKTILKIEDFYETICNTYSKNSRRDISKYYNRILEKISIIQK